MCFLCNRTTIYVSGLVSSLIFSWVQIAVWLTSEAGIDFEMVALKRFEFNVNAYFVPLAEEPPPTKCNWLEYPVVQEHMFFSQPKMKEYLGRCALVGSGEVLMGLGLGKEIDKHDTVIRVNELPARNMLRDSGTSTDIYFVGAVVDEMDRFQHDGYWAMYMNKTGDLSHDFCPWSGKDTEACPFDALVFNRGGVQIGEKWAARYPRWLSPFSPSPFSPGPSKFTFPVSIQGQQPYQVVRMLEPEFDHNQATSGIQAIFTFISMCDTFALYGLNGSELELALVDKILEGKPFRPRTRFLHKSLVNYLQCLAARAHMGTFTKVI